MIIRYGSLTGFISFVTVLPVLLGQQFLQSSFIRRRGPGRIPIFPWLYSHFTHFEGEKCRLLHISRERRKSVQRGDVLSPPLYTEGSY